MNDNINMDSTIAGSVNDNINMDSTIAGSVNDNMLFVLLILVVTNRIVLELVEGNGVGWGVDQQPALKIMGPSDLSEHPRVTS
jgi:hypothetical protein